VLPFDSYVVKASVSGKVIFADKNDEGEIVNDKTIVKIDDFKDKADLNNLNSQIAILKKEIKNQKKIVNRKYETYLKYEKLSSKSQQEKDMKFYNYTASYNQLLGLESQLSNLIANKKKLLYEINQKNVKVKGFVNKILVDKDDYVMPGTPLAEMDDISKEKIYVYVPIGKATNLKNKKVFINGKKSDFKIVKVWKVPDDRYITSYKVEIVGKGLKIGNIVKVTFK
jgi:hypothetical protein